MGWLEVSVKVIPEAAEAVSELLSRYAPEGVAIHLNADGMDVNSPVVVKAYLVQDEKTEERRQKIEEGLWYLHQIWAIIPEPTYAFIADQDWTAGWKESIPILHIGQRVVIKPSWRDYVADKNEVILELDPGLAFGSGLHPTTQLCIEALEDIIHPDMRVLDIGTGTGILALAAARLGAHYVMAVDTDANAIRAAGQNAAANNCQDVIHLKQGSLADAHEFYDIVLANILAPTIISMIDSGIGNRLVQNGVLIVSGILTEQVDDVKAAMDQHNLRITEIRQRDDWVALVARQT